MIHREAALFASKLMASHAQLPFHVRVLICSPCLEYCVQQGLHCGKDRAWNISEHLAQHHWCSSGIRSSWCYVHWKLEETLGLDRVYTT